MDPTHREEATALLLASPTVEHDQVQAALAGNFSATAIEAPQAALDDASVSLFGTAAEPVRDQAHALADVLTNRLCLSPECQDHRALLIDHALTRRAAHPLQIAVIGHELCRRAGVASFVGVCDGKPWTVVRGDSGMALIGPGEIAERPEAPSVRPRCPHQVVAAVLAELSALAPPDSARRAARLLRAVPVSGCRRRRG